MKKSLAALVATALGVLISEPPTLAQETLTGRLGFVWHDPVDQAGESSLSVYLSTSATEAVRLEFAEGRQPPLPDLLRMREEVVTVTGVWSGRRAAGQADDVFVVYDVDWVRPEDAPDARISGAQPWVTIRCRYSDWSLPLPSRYNLSIFTSTSYPSLDEYWRETSNNQINLSGSLLAANPVTGDWFDLPQPRSFYMNGPNANFSQLARDCTAAADSAVNFSGFVGINLLFDRLTNDNNTWNGGGFRLALDGVDKVWRMTWIGIPADLYYLGFLAGMAHETGHGFGFPHSSGPYAFVYDSKWDVMSSSYVRYDPAVDLYNPQGTISYHKDLAAWIPPARKFVPALNTTTMITIERLQLPPGASGTYLMAQIPIGGSSSRFYTVELRQLVGHDTWVPGAAVVIHDVLTTRSSPALVVDPDNNGDPNDAGAMWTAGETFVDAPNGVAVTVHAITATSATVTITRGTLYTLSQAGQRFGNAGGTGSVVLQTATPWLPWTASTPAIWINLGATTGTGTTAIPFSVAPTTTPRRATVNIAGRPFTIVEGGIPSLADIDGDTGSDLVVFRPSSGVWYVRFSSSQFSYGNWAGYQWGAQDDIPVIGDFDGDGKTDLAVFRPSAGVWYVRFSSSNFATWAAYAWGLSTDVPLATDFDGDGRTDLTVYRPGSGTWYIRLSSTGYNTWTSSQWGGPGDRPLSADVDGDGKTELFVFRPGTSEWHVRFSSVGYAETSWTVYQWGASGDVPVPADFDGDGRMDLVVYRPSNGTWYVRFSSSQYSYSNWVSYQWGQPTDIPVSTDFDGDGRADLTVFRPSTGQWFTRYSSSGYSLGNSTTHQWGSTGDVPVPLPQ